MDEDEQQEELDDYVEQSKDRELTESEKENIACIYKRLDVNGDGVLSGRELRKGLQFLGLNPTKDDIKRIKAEHNLKSNTVCKAEFERIMKTELVQKINTGIDMMQAFKIFDRDNSGKLNKKELGFALKTLGEQLTDQEVQDLFNILDTDGDGELDYVEASKILA